MDKSPDTPVTTEESAASQAREVYLGANRKKYLVIAALLGLVVVSLIIDIMTGAAMLSPGEVLS